MRTFCRIRELNPSPYAALLEFDDLGDQRLSRAVPADHPRSGWRNPSPSRGLGRVRVTADEDDALRHCSLVTSDKERAENLMTST